MQWFYANAGQQAGPVNDAEFNRLVREGFIQSTTLVWREGMANWEPYAKVAPVPETAPFAPAAAAILASTSPPSGQVACHECGKFVPIEETMQINGVAICAACKPIYVQKMREGTVQFVPAAATDALRYAGFWIRFGAKFIDGMIIAIVLLPLTFLFGFSFTINPSNIPDLTTMLTQMGIQTLLGLLGRMLYTWLLVGRYGATWGKMLVGIKVVMADGRSLTYGRAFARYWAEIVTQFTCYIGYIIAAFDDQKRSLHDHMCNTRVVYK